MASFLSDQLAASPLAKGILVSLCSLCFSSAVSAQTCASANEYMSMGMFPKDGSGLKAGNQFGFNFSGQYTNFSAIKLYIPPGTTEFNVKGFLSQQVPYAVVSRLGQPPTRRTAVDGSVGSGEYGAINASSTKSTLAARLLGGEEMIFVHDGGGNTTYGDANLFRWPLLKGKWLYTRVLTGFDIVGLQAGGTVDKTLFTSLIATTPYDASAQSPLEDCALPVKPTGIQLDAASVQAGGSGEVRPIPADALVIGECSADPSSPISPYIQFNNYKFTVLSGAPTGTVTIGCGNATDSSSGTAMLSWPSVVQPKFTTTLTIGTPLPLTGVTLSASSLKASQPAQTITISAQPAGASLGTCTISDGSLATVSGTAISLTEAGKAVSTARNLSVTCSGLSAPFSIEPLPSLTITPSTLSQASSGGSTVRKSDGTAASSCTFSSSTAGFDPNTYLDWLSASATIKFKSAAPTLKQKQVVSVTCDGSLATNLTLDPAPVGILYPLHNDEASTETTKPTRDPKQLLLRWREADSAGKTTDFALASKYPSYPTTGSNTGFDCRDSSGNFTLDTTSTPSSTLTLADKTRTASVITKVTCWVQDSSTFIQKPETVKSTPSIKVNIDGTWEIAQPTKDNPIMDVSDGTSAKIQLYVPLPTSTSSTTEVPVVLMGYVPRSPSWLWDDDVRTEVMLTGAGWKFWTGKETDTELLYTRVSNTQPNRILDIDLLFPKTTYTSLKAKIAVFYKDGTTWKVLTTPETEWDSTK